MAILAAFWPLLVFLPPFWPGGPKLEKVVSSQSRGSRQSIRCNITLQSKFGYTTFLLLSGQRWLYFFTSTPQQLLTEMQACSSSHLQGKANDLRQQVLSDVKPHLTGFNQCFKRSACITKTSSDFNCKIPFPFKTRKHGTTISYSQLILQQWLQNSHSGGKPQMCHVALRRYKPQPCFWAELKGEKSEKREHFLLSQDSEDCVEER